MITVLPDRSQLARTAAERVVAAARAADERSGRFVVALAGGATPRQTYEELAREPCRGQVAWPRTWVVFGDERCVPPEHPDSNAGMALEALLRHVEIPPDHVLRMPAELREPEAAAALYERTLRELFPGAPWPRIDLTLLGVGADGHTASLFPGAAALDEDRRWVVATSEPARGRARLTLTLPALRASRAVLFVVAGADKADVVAEIWGGRSPAARHPAARVCPEDGALEVLVDREAASALQAA